MGAAENGFACDEANSDRPRFSSSDHNQLSNGSAVAENRGDERDSDSPNPEYVEAYQLFEAWCEERGIAPKDRHSFGEPLARQQTAALTGYAVPSIRIYYHDFSSKRADFDRVRFLEDSTKDKPLKGAPTFRYWQQSGTSPRAYFPKVRGVNWNDIAADTGITILLAEGEAKAWALTQAGRRCIGIAGVWMSESLRNGQFLLPELEMIRWQGRTAEIAFDADIREKPGVQAACAAVMRELLNRGAKPSSVLLPGPEKGVDDYLKAHSVEEFDQLPREKFGPAEPLYKLNSQVAFLYDPHAIIDKETGKLKSVREMRERFANQRVVTIGRDGKPRIRGLFEVWMEWALRRDFTRMDYLPGQPRELGDTWNRWEAWGAEAVDGDVSLWDQLMGHVFGTSQEGLKARKYFEQWAAFPIQHPGKKMHVSTVLVGRKQGTGKSLTFNILGSVYGRNFKEIGSEQLVSTFNEFLVDTQFVLGDEVTNREDVRRDIDKFKRMISRRTVEINAKHIRQYTIRDCVNWGLTTNHFDSIFVDDEDRRFFMWEIQGGKLPQKLKEGLVEWLERGRCAAPLRWHLGRVDLTGFDPTADAPGTAAKAEAKEHNKSGLELQIDQMLATEVGAATSNPGWPFGKSDVWSLLGIQLYLRLGGHSTRTIASYLLKQKDTASLGNITVDGIPRKVYAIRNAARWRAASHSELVKEYGRWDDGSKF